MDFRLKVFATTAKYLSFKQAVTELGISQPAITKNIQELEKQFGVLLFERKGNKLSLTQQGELLLAKCHAVLKEYAELEKEAALLSKTAASKINLWIPYPLYCGIFMNLLADYSRLASASNINAFISDDISKEPKSESADNISDYDIEILYNNKQPQGDTNTILQDRLIAVGSGDFDNNNYFDIEDLRFVFYKKDSATNQDIVALFAQSQYSFSKIAPIANFADSSAAIHFLKSFKKEKKRTPFAIAFLWKSQIENELAQGSLKEVKITEFQDIAPIRRYYSVDIKNNELKTFSEYIFNWFANRAYTM